MQMAKAAYAIGVEKKVVEKWFERRNLVMPRAKSGSGEVAYFHDYDLAHLALIKVLDDYGVPIEIADRLIKSAFKLVGARRAIDGSRLLLEPWRDHTLVVFRKPDGNWTISNFADKDGKPISSANIDLASITGTPVGLMIKPYPMFERLFRVAQELRTRKRGHWRGTLE